MNGAVCIHLTHFLIMIERVRVLYLIIITKSEIRPIYHCLGLGHEAIVNAVCVSIFLGPDYFNQTRLSEAEGDESGIHIALAYIVSCLIQPQQYRHVNWDGNNVMKTQ